MTLRFTTRKPRAEARRFLRALKARVERSGSIRVEALEAHVDYTKPYAPAEKQHVEHVTFRLVLSVEGRTLIAAYEHENLDLVVPSVGLAGLCTVALSLIFGKSLIVGLLGCVLFYVFYFALRSSRREKIEALLFSVARTRKLELAGNPARRALPAPAKPRGPVLRFACSEPDATAQPYVDALAAKLARKGCHSIVVSDRALQAKTTWRSWVVTVEPRAAKLVVSYEVYDPAQAFRGFGVLLAFLPLSALAFWQSELLVGLLVELVAFIVFLILLSRQNRYGELEHTLLAVARELELELAAPKPKAKMPRELGAPP